MAGTSGVPNGGTGNLCSVGSGRRLLLVETRAELELCLRLAPLEQLCQSNLEQQCHQRLAATTGRAMLSFKKTCLGTSWRSGIAVFGITLLVKYME